MIADGVNMNRDTVYLILNEELRMRNICAKMMPRNLTGTTVGSAAEHSFYHPNALRWCWSLLIHLISNLMTSFYYKNKISSERTPFWVNRRHPEGCNTDLKWHPTKCVPGMLKTMAAPLEKVCAGTRDVLWKWPHCSWINKIKLFWDHSHYFIVRSCMCVAGFAVLLTSWFWHDSELLHVELLCDIQPSTLFTWPSINHLLSIS